MEETNQKNQDNSLKSAHEESVALEENEEESKDAAESLAEEVSTLKDQLLRAFAEAENIRKRALRDRDEAHKFAVTTFARDMLSVSDNLNRGLSSVSEDQIQDNPLLKILVDGILMTQNEMISVLERHGIKKVNALGEKFNPHFHQAMVEIPDEKAAPGTIIQVLQEGYQIHDRLLRPALVAVVKAGVENT